MFRHLHGVYRHGALYLALSHFFPFSHISLKVGDTARDIAIQSGFKSIAKKLAPANSKDNWKVGC